MTAQGQADRMVWPEGRQVWPEYRQCCLAGVSAMLFGRSTGNARLLPFGSLSPDFELLSSRPNGRVVSRLVVFDNGVPGFLRGFDEGE